MDERRGVLHLRRRLGRRRHGGQARAPLLGRARPPREADHHLARARLPRHRTRSARASQGIPANREGYGDLIPHIENIPWGDADALEALLVDHADRIAAFIGEPVIGAGGVIPPPEGFWPRVQELCRRHDVLLISDEVICGFGRLGADFGCQRFGVDARSHDVRQGPDVRLRADGRRRRLRPRQAAVLRPRARASCSATATPTAAIPRRAAAGPREPRDHRARGTRRARARARAGARGGLSGALRRASDGRRGALGRPRCGSRVHARGAGSDAAACPTSSPTWRSSTASSAAGCAASRCRSRRRSSSPRRRSPRWPGACASPSTTRCGSPRAA